MKKSHVATFATVIGGRNWQLAARAVGLYRLIDQPSVRQLEDRVILCGGPPYPPEVDALAKAASLAIFGIETVEFEVPAGRGSSHEPEDEYWRIEDQRASFEQRFVTTRLRPEDVLALMLGYDLDFTNELGQPLRCTPLLACVAEAAAKGIKGKMPDRKAADAEAWGRSREREREQWLRSRRR